MNVKPAKKNDLISIQNLLKVCELPFEDLTSAHLDHFFVIHENDEIIGSIGLEVTEHYGLLRSLAVAANQRRKGFGIQLTESIEAYAQSQNITAMYLLTTTADHFFSKLGFEVTVREQAPAPLQETVEFQSICPTSAVCMVKDINA